MVYISQIKKEIFEVESLVQDKGKIFSLIFGHASTNRSQAGSILFIRD